MKENILNSLELMWKGMLGIFVIIIAIIIIVMLLNYITKDRKNKVEDSSRENNTNADNNTVNQVAQSQNQAEVNQADNAGQLDKLEGKYVKKDNHVMKYYND